MTRRSKLLVIAGLLFFGVWYSSGGNIAPTSVDNGMSASPYIVDNSEVALATSERPAPAERAEEAADVEAPVAPTIIAIGRPVLFEVPDLGLEIDIYEHQGTEDQFFYPQEDEVAWWNSIGVPGDGLTGDALLAGHVNTVFQDLVRENGEDVGVLVGTRIYITDSSDQRFEFVVEDADPSSEEVAIATNKDDLDLVDLFRTTPGDQEYLWIITCSDDGGFEDGMRVQNRVVMARFLGLA